MVAFPCPPGTKTSDVREQSMAAECLLKSESRIAHMIYKPEYQALSLAHVCMIPSDVAQALQESLLKQDYHIGRSVIIEVKLNL